MDKMQHARNMAEAGRGPRMQDWKQRTPIPHGAWAIQVATPAGTEAACCYLGPAPLLTAMLAGLPPLADLWNATVTGPHGAQVHIEQNPGAHGPANFYGRNLSTGEHCTPATLAALCCWALAQVAE